MDGISDETRKSLVTLCYNLVHKKEELPKENFKSLYMWGKFPHDIEIDEEIGDGLGLFGNDYTQYQKVVYALRGEAYLEYMRDREITDTLWHFVCEVMGSREKYKDLAQLKEKIDIFLKDIVKPLKEYEVLIPINYLDIGENEINIGDIIIKKISEDNAKDWATFLQKKPYEDVYGKTFFNKTCSIVPGVGNNLEFVVRRAKDKLDLALNSLISALSTHRSIHDSQLLFTQSETAIYRIKDDPNSGSTFYIRDKDKPITLTVDQTLKDIVIDFHKKIENVLKEDGPSKKLKKRLQRTMIWIGRGIKEPDLDEKIVNYSTSLEALLVPEHMGNKGETLAYRLLLLNVCRDDPFTHPADILRFYEIRSDIVHGAKIDVASERDCTILRGVVIEAFLHAVSIIKKEKLTRHSQFINVIENEENIETVLNWLRKEGDKRTSSVREIMEKHLYQRIN